MAHRLSVPTRCALGLCLLLGGCAGPQRHRVIPSPHTNTVAGEQNSFDTSSYHKPLPSHRQVELVQFELPNPAHPVDSVVPASPNFLIDRQVDMASQNQDVPLAPRRMEELFPTVQAAEDEQTNTIEIDFASALSMAAGQNPQVAFAEARIREATAQWRAARALWLPSIRAGVSWNKHQGLLQASSGTILDVNRTSLNTGLGVRAVGTGTHAVPGVLAEFHASDAVFQPRITGFVAEARQEASRAATNDILMETALAYLELLRANQQYAISQDARRNAENLAGLTEKFALTGQGLQADADRAQAELSLRTNDVARAEEATLVASARLAELLRVDPQTKMLPQEIEVVPIDLVASATPLSELVAIALTNRPELQESRSLVCAAVNRLRRERYSPLLPSVLLGVSYGGYGGGIGSSVGSLDDRLDLDAAAFWELRNLGFGERTARAEASARLDQAEIREVAVMDRIAREITEAHAQVTMRQRQMATAQEGVKAATQSYERNTQRIREGQGLPIEVLQSIQALDQTRRDYLRSVTDYNTAQFRLHRALGWPIL